MFFSEPKEHEPFPLGTCRVGCLGKSRHLGKHSSAFVFCACCEGHTQHYVSHHEVEGFLLSVLMTRKTNPAPRVPPGPASRFSQPREPSSPRSQTKDPKPKTQSERSQTKDPKRKIPSKRSKVKDPKAKHPKRNIPKQHIQSERS